MSDHGEQKAREVPLVIDLMQALKNSLRPAVSRETLLAAITKHRDAKGHDRCHLNDRELYAAAGLDPADFTLPPRAEFLTACSTYYARQCGDAAAAAVDVPLFDDLGCIYCGQRVTLECRAGHHSISASPR